MRKCNSCKKEYDPKTSKGVGTWLVKYCSECVDKAVSPLVALWSEKDKKT